jgi:hypothetical protein
MNYEQLQRKIEENLPIPTEDELWEAIINKDLGKYTPKQVEKGMLQKKCGNTLYHKAAQNGHLDKIPRNLLTAENLLKANSDGDTCLHYAAYEDHLNQIPPLAYKTLLNLKTHFERNYSSGSWAGEGQIHLFLTERIEKMKIETIRRSCTIDHKPIL